MKYAINYYRGCPILAAADEVILEWTEPNENIISYVKEHYKREQRIILGINTILDFEDLEKSLDIFCRLKQEHDNIAIRLNITIAGMSGFAADLYEKDVPFFFINGVENLDTLMSYLKLHVSDVYIINELGFSLKQISTLCKDLDVNIRVYPNVAQSSSDIGNLDSMKMFYVRPEDISAYEQYVDIFEFYGPLNKQKVLLDIYKDGKWLSDLNYLILDFKGTVPNSQIVPYFGEERVKCQKKCVYGKCTLCDRIQSLAIALKEKGYVITEGKSIYED